MPIIRVPDVREAILASPCFQSPFDSNSYAAIFHRLGVALDIGKTFIDKITIDEQHADIAQAVIGEVSSTLSSYFAAIDLAWVPDSVETPFWRSLVASAEEHLGMYAYYIALGQTVLTHATPEPTEPTEPAERPAAIPRDGCC